MKKRTIKAPVLYREMPLDRASLNKEKRTIDVAFSSEFPVERWFGMEVLDHGNPKSANLGRLQRGGAVLVDHNRSDHVGVVESARIDPDRVGRATIRFGKSARAQEIFTDVEDGIRTAVSVGYRNHKMAKEREEEGVETFRITSWEPMEISIVAIPADPTVGVGRAARDGEENEIEVEEPEAPQPTPENRTMETPPNNAPTPPQPDAATLERVRVEATRAEQARVTEINGIANHWRAKCPEVDQVAAECIGNGTNVGDFRKLVMEKLSNAGNALRTPPPSALIGMNEKDIKRYSFARAIAMAAEDELDGLEKECHDEGTKRAKANGLQLCGNLFIPHDVLSAQRAEPGSLERAQEHARNLIVGTASLGGNLVATELLAGSFIELLRHNMVVARLGARNLTGLVGNVAIPRQATGQAAAWMASEAATASSADFTIDQVTLSPKTLVAIRTYSKLLLTQSTPDIDTLVRNDVAQSIALGIDLAALHGTGSSGQPTGIVNQTGVGSVLAGNGTNGADPVWQDIVDLETDVSTADAAMGSLAYLTSYPGRGFLKTIPKSTVVGFNFIWEPYPGTPPIQGMGMLNGYPAAVSSQVTSGATVGSSSGNASFLFFGNWADVLIGLWGGLDVTTDPFTLLTTRMVRVAAHQFADVALRHGESFSVMTDMETS